MLDESTQKKEVRMCKIATRNAGMKQDDIARILNVSRCVVSKPLKEHRESSGIAKKKNETVYIYT